MNVPKEKRGGGVVISSSLFLASCSGTHRRLSDKILKAAQIAPRGSSHGAPQLRSLGASMNDVVRTRLIVRDLKRDWEPVARLPPSLLRPRHARREATVTQARLFRSRHARHRGPAPLVARNMRGCPRHLSCSKHTRSWPIKPQARAHGDCFGAGSGRCASRRQAHATTLQ